MLRPLGLGEVRITGGYWADAQRRNAETSLWHCLEWVERIGWLGNFDAAAATPDDGRHRGVVFADSEVYKLLEAIAWELGRAPEERLAAAYDDLVARVAGAQRADGYLNTAFGRPGLPERYSNLEEGHELYCFGHLIQAAVARVRTGHDDLLVEVADRAAAHLWREFGPTGRQAIGGHPEIEVALAEYARARGEARHLELARLFIERRGHGTLATTMFRGRDYFQDDVPVREATVLRGHAVRALYLAAGAADVAVDTGDAGLLDAVRRQWEATVARRTYLTGGMGSHHQNEDFGDDYELPPDRAYSETCAGVGSVMLGWRLLLQSGEARFADLIERTLYNVVMASPRADGRAFFYTNTLHQRTRDAAPPEDALSERAEVSMRAPWFEVSCCPTNVARTLASLAGYLATADADGVQLHQFADAEVETVLGDGVAVRLRMRTGYPFDGRVEVTVLEAAAFTLALRVPAWVRHDPRVRLDGPGFGEPTAGPEPDEQGYLRIRRSFAAGDTVTLTLPVEPRVTRPSPRIDAVRGTVAVERGPLVLCLESTDLPEGLEVDAAELAAGPVVRPTADGALVRVRMRDARGEGGWPYAAGSADDAAGSADAAAGGEIDVPLHPYAGWGNRGPSTMRVWIPTARP